MSIEYEYGPPNKDGFANFLAVDSNKSMVIGLMKSVAENKNGMDPDALQGAVDEMRSSLELLQKARIKSARDRVSYYKSLRVTEGEKELAALENEAAPLGTLHQAAKVLVEVARNMPFNWGKTRYR